ncbi:MULTISPECIES: c-type cytochrome [unclassified Novosphingobium]|uniref:c-type cytochrome n=1 Tax=Novosphingobium TaxID=165696 RepID=UPI00146E1A54|nr:MULTISPECIES: cytochrome c family protein [unclassified Novosphingobium]NMN04991.1 cytochrome c [Novosphingobium sp. SG919]NMN87285.1 cytochrome c [Novosphingobium sp. SG916]
MKSKIHYLVLGSATLLLAACGGGSSSDKSAAEQAPAASETTTAAAAAMTPAAATSTAAPTADSTDTLDGTTLASLTGDAVHGKAIFTQCQACHSAEPGKNMIGPSLAGVVGRKAGQIAGFAYSNANKNSGITWTAEKLFQYLEKPQRVVPGTKMTFAGLPKAQDRADVIAYLKNPT